MKDDTAHTGIEENDLTDNNLTVTYTQVASCAMGSNSVERRRQSLRARLERERFERQKQLDQSFISSVRNLFGLIRH
ncbi:MAG: hypothetical protein GY935_06950 [Gammaproteobacteria bacterium]|nr:hypothetical protein [Gammaproteobacteria bacterium]